jgi:hypothetical protein
LEFFRKCAHDKWWEEFSTSLQKKLRPTASYRGFSALQEQDNTGYSPCKKHATFLCCGTNKLRVVNSAELQAYKVDSSTAKGQSPSLDPISAVQAIQAEAKEEAKKQGWQPTLIYFENAERGLYQIVLAEDTEHMRQTLQEGLIRVGFFGGRDTPKGIQFEFALDDSFPMNGIVAKRFVKGGDRVYNVLLVR